jgi:ABC-type sugar transport system substrate-binding protein
MRTDEEIRMIDDLIARRPDAIIFAASNAEAMVPVAKKAKTVGVKVITYDGDVADPTARHWFVNQGTFTIAGAALVDVVAEEAGANARFAVVSTDPGAFSQNSWIAAMKAQMQAKYPKMELVDIRYGLGKPAESLSVTHDLINKFQVNSTRSSLRRWSAFQEWLKRWSGQASRERSWLPDCPHRTT